MTDDDLIRILLEKSGILCNLGLFDASIMAEVSFSVSPFPIRHVVPTYQSWVTLVKCCEEGMKV